MNSKYFHCIIEYYDKANLKYITHQDILKCVSNMPNIKEYSFILHDKDLKNDEDLIRPHYHINLIFDNQGYEEFTILHKFASYLLINVNCIGVKATNSNKMYEYVRYLIHYDNLEKYQYKIDDILTNNKYNVNRCLNGFNPYIIDICYLVDLINSSDNIINVFGVLGMKFTNQYYKVIVKLRETIKKGVI